MIAKMILAPSILQLLHISRIVSPQVLSAMLAVFEDNDGPSKPTAWTHRLYIWCLDAM